MKRNYVANDNDYTIEEPAEKNVRKLEEEDIYYEVLELRLKVIKLEKDYQSACRLANEYETQLQEYRERVESLENLLDAKPVITSSEETNELMRQVDELTQRLCEYEKLPSGGSRRMANELSMTMFDLQEASRKNETLQFKVDMLQCKNDMLSKVESIEPVATVELNENETKELKRKLGMTMFQLEVEKFSNEKLATENNAMACTIGELRRANEEFKTGEKDAKKVMMKLYMATNKLEEANKVNEDLKLCNNELLRRLADSEQVAKDESIPLAASVSNIFTLRPLKTPGMITPGKAVSMLQKAYFPSDLEWMEKYKQVVKDNIRDQRGTVSLAALEYWMDKLDEIPKPNLLEPTSKPPLPKQAKRTSVMMLDEDIPD